MSQENTINISSLTESNLSFIDVLLITLIKF